MLAEYVDEKKILLGLEEHTFRGTLMKMLEKSVEDDADVIVEKILQREKVMPTALGKGVFLPRVVLHEKSSSEVIIAVSPKGMRYDDDGAVTANIVMLFIFSGKSDYAAILAQSLRLLTDDTLRSDLLKSKKPKAIIKAISDWEKE